MTSERIAETRQRWPALAAVVRALRDRRTWRATLYALTGLPVGVLSMLVTFAILTIWIAAVWSLVEGPGGDRVLVVIYLLYALGGPIVLSWVVRGFNAANRLRLRKILGVAVVPAPRARAPWPLRVLGLGTGPGVWRQIGYHIFATINASGGGLVIVTAWMVAFPIAPFLAQALARVDENVALELLGPTRTEELTQRVESLARSRADVVAATDAERRRIERDLHDGAQQRLVSLALNLGMARANLTDMPEPARQAIAAAHDEATQALAELREFVRGLHPAVLNDRGLDAALSGIVARAPLPVRLHVDVSPRCSPSVEAIAYFVVSEALTNVAKHAHARSADVSVERLGDRLKVVVRDDGRGGAGIDAGSGLLGLARRAAAVDGTLSLHSPPGGPTTIAVELPCE